MPFLEIFLGKVVFLEQFDAIFIFGEVLGRIRREVDGEKRFRFFTLGLIGEGAPLNPSLKPAAPSEPKLVEIVSEGIWGRDQYQLQITSVKESIVFYCSFRIY